MITNHQQRMKHKTVSNTLLFCSVGRKTVLFLLWLNCEPEANIYHAKRQDVQLITYEHVKNGFLILKSFKGDDSGNVTFIKQEIVTVIKTNKFSNFLRGVYVVTRKAAVAPRTLLNLDFSSNTHLFSHTDNSSYLLGNFLWKREISPGLKLKCLCSIWTICQ